jgi:hypothetical protein
MRHTGGLFSLQDVVNSLVPEWEARHSLLHADSTAVNIVGCLNLNQFLQHFLILTLNLTLSDYTRKERCPGLTSVTHCFHIALVFDKRRVVIFMEKLTF